MDLLSLHPKFQDLKEECLQFPDHAEQLFQVYLDLTQAKDFEDVHVIKAPLLGRCLIEGVHPDNGNRYLVLPTLATEPWSVTKMEASLSALSNEPDPRLKAAAASSTFSSTTQMEHRFTSNWSPRDDNAVPDDNPESWACEKPVYEWKEDYSEGTAPSNSALEAELYDEEGRLSVGVHFDNYHKISVSRKGGPDTYIALTSFAEAKFHPTIVDNIKRMNYSNPTPIQKHAIPLLMSGYDLLACAQTGSGKTAAFLLPVLSKILTKMSRDAAPLANRPGARRTKASPQALIILPTRELAIQIFDEARRFSYMSRVRPVVIYGGAEMRVQKEQLARGCDILIATPGRLVDAMERGAVALDSVRYLVLDEADRVLDLGFEETIRRILLSSDLPRDEGLHTMLFSATFPPTIQALARDFMMDDYCRLRIGRIGGTTTDIMQKVIQVEEYDKEETLHELLLSQPPSRTLVFVETKRRADYLDDLLYNRQLPCISLHGDRSQRERELALEAFKSGRSPILIATAVAARGLDIKDVYHVINYDLCDDIDEYVHRIGRTARAGNPGLATSFYNDRNYMIAPLLTKLLMECQQEVPEFLKEYISHDVDYDTDFLEPDALDQITLTDRAPDTPYSGGYVDKMKGVSNEYGSASSSNAGYGPHTPPGSDPGHHLGGGYGPSDVYGPGPSSASGSGYGTAGDYGPGGVRPRPRIGSGSGLEPGTGSGSSARSGSNTGLGPGAGLGAGLGAGSESGSGASSSANAGPVTSLGPPGSESWDSNPADKYRDVQSNGWDSKQQSVALGWN
ncbi:hypothetical protein BGZ99_004367 [Dissophora globulifera]|uniref:RNA helicase n=1 Tax=Dissophora globulifera TaxID=979702 RepID=A0A9P6RMP2_9FUNG|nr:hypothetical protein BGZ99_004367 [Dissophora globulifera]